MKESKKRENSGSKKKKHGSSSLNNLDSWDQTDLEDADEKVLERRLHQLKMQLQMAQDEGSHGSRHGSSSKHKKKHVLISSDSDSSDSGSTLSSTSSISVRKYKSKKSSSVSDDDRKKYKRSPLSRKKAARELKMLRKPGKGERENTINPKADKKIIFRKKASPVMDKYASRKKSPSLDKREIYSRVDTGRWHEKAKEFGKERNKRGDAEQERTRARSRLERNRSISMSRERERRSSRGKEDRAQKKLIGRGAPLAATATAARRKESPEPVRARGLAYDNVRRAAVIPRKLSPRDERPGRHDERRLDLKVTRKNDVRSDLRDVNLRITRDVRERKDPPAKPPEKPRERELVGKTHREVIEHGLPDVGRDRSRGNDDRFKERGDKRLHDRLEPERNAVRGVRHDSRDSLDDKFRRNDRSTAEVNRGGGVFDRMRNRYNDRRNAENNQRLGRDRGVVEAKKDRPPEKETLKSRSVDMNGADRVARDRRPMVMPVRARSPLHRDRKEPERNVGERRSPVNFDRKFSSPLNSRKAREVENRVTVKRKSLENEDPQWNKKKGPNKVRSRSRSSEKRRRRRSSQEEWRVIDMTSPVLDDELSDENNRTSENNVQKMKRPVVNKVKQMVKTDDADESDASKQNKTMLTDELSDISDEDFNDVNATHITKIKKDNVFPRNDRLTKNDKIDRKPDQKFADDQDEFDYSKASSVIPDTKDAVSDVDALIGDQKLTTGEHDVNLDKVSEDLDSEEETVSRVSDALGVDWADLVEESKRKTPVNTVDESLGIRRRWSAASVLMRIGVSEKYAGEELFSQIEKDLRGISDPSGENVDQESNADDDTNRLWHKVAGLHVCLKDKAVRRRTLFEPYKTAISARKDIAIRRRLCGLPVKNLRTQQMIGICHWII